MRLIDADAYADHLENELRENIKNVKQRTFTDFLIASAVIAAIASDLRNEKITPTIDSDMSEYSDRLWKLAYERGKKEGSLEDGKE